MGVTSDNFSIGPEPSRKGWDADFKTWDTGGDGRHNSGWECRWGHVESRMELRGTSAFNARKGQRTNSQRNRKRTRTLRG